MYIYIYIYIRILPVSFPCMWGVGSNLAASSLTPGVACAGRAAKLGEMLDLSVGGSAQSRSLLGARAELPGRCDHQAPWNSQAAG